MIQPRELLDHAAGLLAASKDEADVRRAISAAYYSMFHTLAQAGSRFFGAAGAMAVQRATRAFSHTTVRKVCEAYIRSPSRPFQPPLDVLVPTKPDPRLIVFASAFTQLQSTRELADYDLSTSFTHADGTRLVVQARASLDDWPAIQHLPETATFLTALLLADRWTRRG